MTKSREYREKYPNKPWLDAPNIWPTEAAFWNYIRGVLRRGWKDYPLKIKFKLDNTIPNFEGSGITNPKVKKVGKCAICGEWFPSSGLQIDHVEQAGSMKGYDQMGTFAHNLFTTVDNMQLLCEKTCHPLKSYAERMGLSLEDAIIEKQVVAFGKLPAEEQIEKIKEIGLSPDRYPNKDKRKDVFREYLKLKRE